MKSANLFITNLDAIKTNCYYDYLASRVWSASTEARAIHSMNYSMRAMLAFPLPLRASLCTNMAMTVRVRRTSWMYRWQFERSFSVFNFSSISCPTIFGQNDVGSLRRKFIFLRIVYMNQYPILSIFTSQIWNFRSYRSLAFSPSISSLLNDRFEWDKNWTIWFRFEVNKLPNIARANCFFFHFFSQSNPMPKNRNKN